MAKKKYNFYAVALGHKCGLYTDWPSCQAQVSGFSGADYKGFKLREEAVAWLRERCREPWEDETGQTGPVAGPAGGQPATGPEVPAAQAEGETGATAAPGADQGPAPLTEEVFRQRLQARLAAGREQAEPLTESVNRYCQEYNFTKLTPDQRRAVQQVQGKVLLFAVPGSGKTSVIIARAGYLLHGGHGEVITPRQLMTLTFTRAAAQEMRERYSRHFPQAGKPPEFRTIHSFCLSRVIPRLKDAGMKIPPYILGEEQEEAKEGQRQEKRVTLQQVLRETVRRADPDHKRRHLSQDDITALTIALTGIKNCLLQPEDYREKVIFLKDITLKVPAVLEAYQAVLQEHSCIDFDDMIGLAVQGLQEHPQVLRALQAAYPYWSVDEAQDNSRLQQALLQLLVGEQGNLFVVGDDDQSIYAFRGAAPRLLLEYGLQDRVKALVMGMNFRSDSLIVRLAEQFIRSNRRRAEKEMRACSAQQGEISFYTHLQTQTDQYDYIVRAAREAQAAGRSLGVLYRLNASALPVMLQLHRAGIRFAASKSLTELLQGKLYQEIMALLRLAAEPGDLKRFKACRYLLGFSGDTLWKMLEKKKHQQPQAEIAELLAGIGSERDPQGFAARVKKYRELLTVLRQSTAFEAVREIIRFAGLSAAASNGAERLRLYGMLSAAEGFADVPGLLQAIAEVNRQLQESDADKEAGKGPLVSLSTMHGAKGLQYDRVLIIDSFADVMNNQWEGEPNELVFADSEEERRLFYVALTRAQRRLELLAVQQYWGEIVPPSSFLTECAQLYEELLEEPLEELPCLSGEEIRRPAPEQTIPQGKVYAVRVGRETGIFTSWAECERAVKGYSGAVPRKFESRAEAEAYLGNVSPEQEPLRHEFLDSVLLPAPVHAFNYQADLPPLVTEAILAWLGVPAVAELPRQSWTTSGSTRPAFATTGKPATTPTPPTTPCPTCP